MNISRRQKLNFLSSTTFTLVARRVERLSDSEAMVGAKGGAGQNFFFGFLNVHHIGSNNLKKVSLCV